MPFGHGGAGVSVLPAVTASTPLDKTCLGKNRPLILHSLARSAHRRSSEPRAGSRELAPTWPPPSSPSVPQGRWVWGGLRRDPAGPGSAEGTGYEELREPGRPGPEGSADRGQAPEWSVDGAQYAPRGAGAAAHPAPGTNRGTRPGTSTRLPGAGTDARGNTSPWTTATQEAVAARPNSALSVRRCPPERPVPRRTTRPPLPGADHAGPRMSFQPWLLVTLSSCERPTSASTRHCRMTACPPSPWAPADSAPPAAGSKPGS